MEENEWIEAMKGLVSTIEERIAEHLFDGRDATILIANDNSIRQIESFLYPNESFNWSQEVYFKFADGEISLRVLRTVDMKNGQIFVL